MKERINELISAIGISGREFCKSIGQSDSWNRTIGKSIGTDAVVNILTAYPSVNIYWLILGEGEMFVNEQPSSVLDGPRTEKIKKGIEDIWDDIREDNKNLREENTKLRENLLDMMEKNSNLMVELAQKRTKEL